MDDNGWADGAFVAFVGVYVACTIAWHMGSWEPLLPASCLAYLLIRDIVKILRNK